MKSSDIAKRGSLLFDPSSFLYWQAITNRPLEEQPIRMQDVCQTVSRFIIITNYISRTSGLSFKNGCSGTSITVAFKMHRAKRTVVVCLKIWSMYLYEFYPFLPYFLIFWEDMHRNPRSIAVICTANISWATGHASLAFSSS